MKTHKTTKVAIIKNSHTTAERREIEEEFVRDDTPRYTLKELLEAESAKKVKV